MTAWVRTWPPSKYHALLGVSGRMFRGGSPQEPMRSLHCNAGRREGRGTKRANGTASSAGGRTTDTRLATSEMAPSMLASRAFFCLSGDRFSVSSSMTCSTWSVAMLMIRCPRVKYSFPDAGYVSGTVITCPHCNQQLRVPALPDLDVLRKERDEKIARTIIGTWQGSDSTSTYTIRFYDNGDAEFSTGGSAVGHVMRYFNGQMQGKWRVEDSQIFIDYNMLAP